MTPERRAKMRASLTLIADDARDDATRLDGMPFTGHAVGSTFGNVLAMVNRIALILIEVLDEDEAADR